MARSFFLIARLKFGFDEHSEHPKEWTIIFEQPIHYGMSSIGTAMKVSLEEMILPPSLKFPGLDIDIDSDAAEAGGGNLPKTNCVVSSPTSVRSLSKVKLNGGEDASSSVNGECRHEATLYTSTSTSSTNSSEEPIERSNAIILLPRRQILIESVLSVTTDFLTDGAVQSIPETPPQNLIDNSSENTTSLFSNQPSGPQTCIAAPPAPITFVGILLERSETVNSWGLLFTKDKGGHALIVRVIPPSMDGPFVKWCQFTTAVPNPSLVYRRKAKSSMTLEQYESFTVRNFPPTNEGNKERHNNSLAVPFLMPGDAILSVNGIPVSALDIGQLASYIRGHCRRKMIMVVMRHESVMNAAQISTPPSIIQDQGLDKKAVTDRAYETIKEAWGWILSSRGIGQQQNNQVKRKTTQPNSNSVKRPKIVYRNVAFQNEEGKPIPYCDNDDLDPDDGNRIDGVSCQSITYQLEPNLCP